MNPIFSSFSSTFSPSINNNDMVQDRIEEGASTAGELIVAVGVAECDAPLVVCNIWTMQGRNE